MSSTGAIIGLLAFSLDLVAFAMLGVGIYLLSELCHSTKRAAKVTGILLLVWIVPTFMWRLNARLFDNVRLEEITRSMNPIEVGQVLTRTLAGGYASFALSGFILSLGFLQLNQLTEKMLNVGMMETGRGRLYSSFGVVNLIATVMISSAFACIDLGLCSLENSTTVASIVLAGLIVKGPLLSVWGISIFSMIRRTLARIAETPVEERTIEK
jgi:hypothetical protein